MLRGSLIYIEINHIYIYIYCLLNKEHVNVIVASTTPLSIVTTKGMKLIALQARKKYM